jgi:hypothetical protein
MRPSCRSERSLKVSSSQSVAAPSVHNHYPSQGSHPLDPPVAMWVANHPPGLPSAGWDIRVLGTLRWAMYSTPGAAGGAGATVPTWALGRRQQRQAWPLSTGPPLYSSEACMVREDRRAAEIRAGLKFLQQYRGERWRKDDRQDLLLIFSFF